MRIFRVDSKRFKSLATLTLYCFIIQIVLPLLTSTSVAFTQSGPSQAETTGFSLNSTGNMVNKFTGDFSYSIPLMDVEGYPITIQYNQNVGMETEASWVGLGWDLSLGSVSRQLRGIPDDFNGEDKIKRIFKVRNNITRGKKNGFSVSVHSQKKGLGLGLTALWGTYNNSYNGPGKTVDFNVAGSFSVGDKIKAGLNLGVGYSFDNQNGAGRSTMVGLSTSKGPGSGNEGGSAGLSASWSSNFNSRGGRLSNTFGLSVNFGNNLKNGSSSMSVSTGATHSLGALTSIPRLAFPFMSNTKSFQLETGGFIMSPGVFIVEGNFVSVHYGYDNKPKVQSINQSALGYMHYGKRSSFSGNGDYPVMDYNFSNIAEITQNTKALPFSAPTYDMFNFTAAGSMGQFRAQRSDMGTLKDPIIESKAKGNSNTVKVGVGGLLNPPGVGFKLGYTYGNQSGSQSSGEWWSKTDDDIKYSGNSDLNAFDETIFIKSVGEITPSNLSCLNQFGGTTPLRRVPEGIEGEGDAIGIGISTSLHSTNGTGMVSNIEGVYGSLNINSRDVIRATQYNLRTVNELTSENTFFNRNNFILTKPKNTNTNSTPYYFSNQNYDRKTTNKKDHHISSPEVITTSGIRYVYDIPVYNLKYDEVSFSASGLKGGLYQTEGLCYYTSGVDNSVNNNRGKAQMFDRTTVPAYAHSFLLTGVFSPDYIDVTNNGPTVDDMGNYYTFNYSALYDESNPFTWRKPYSGQGGQPKAYLDENFISTPNDDVANYKYGEKEMYFIHSVESKNMVAEFVLSERKDAYGQDENGFLRIDMPGYKLERIELYNKNERRNNPNAVPLQVVEFEYDYSLCPNFPLNINTNTGNPNNGKLTLKAIKFKNKNSEEMALAPYLFEYGEGVENKPYSTINVDRWGNYKLNNSIYPNTLYPYTSEDDMELEVSAGNWKLKEITTPQNGKIIVDYQADEYAYVQDKRVMKHMRVLGMTNPMKLAMLMSGDYSSSSPIPNYVSPEHNPFNFLRTKSEHFDNLLNSVVGLANFSGSLSSQEKKSTGRIFGEKNKKNVKNAFRELYNNILLIEVDKPYYINPSNSNLDSKEKLEDEFVNDYLTDSKGGVLTEVYCKTRVKVDIDESKYENIPTFAPISKDIPHKYNDVFDELSLPRIKSYGLIGSESSNYFKYAYIVLEPAGVKDFVTDENGNIKYDKSPYKVNPIQLASFQFSKRHLPDLVYGDVNDDGTVTYKSNLDAKVIFGGNINDELNKQEFCLHYNPTHSFVRLFRQDRSSSSSNARVSSITYVDNWNSMTNSEVTSSYKWKYDYSDTIAIGRDRLSFGVAAYQPQVGNDVNPFYQWKRYTNIVKSYPDESMFTQEPFAEILFPAPTIGYSEVKVHFDNPNQFNNTGKSISNFHTAKDFPTVLKQTPVISQTRMLGFLLVTNRLVGLTQGSVVETNDFHGKPKENRVYDALDNLQSKTKYSYKELGEKVNFVDRDGSHELLDAATEIDVYTESRFVKKISKSWSLGADVFIGVVSGTVPYLSISPDISYVKTRTGFYTNTFNKIINRSAVVESIETEYLGSKNFARNIAYDKHSGNVIISSLKDEYDDELYSMSFPAHWKYDNFRNYHRTQNNLTGAAINVNIFQDSSKVFTEGDIVKISDGVADFYAQVLYRDGEEVKLIDIDTGSKFDEGSISGDVSLVKTMRKNLLSVSMQTVTTKDGSFLDDPNVYNPKNNIISNSVLTFKEGGSIGCNDKVEYKPDSFEANHLGIGGTVNPYKYGLKGIYRIVNSFALQKGRSNFQNIHGTRFDGIIDGYYPFYDLSLLQDGTWVQVNEINHPNYTVGSVPTLPNYKDYRKLGEIVKINEFGKPVQSADQIAINSTVLYGYNSNLKLVPIAQAVNAEQNQIAFDGFEDLSYSPQSSGVLPKEPHFNFHRSESKVTNEEKHSGLMSVALNPGDSLVGSREITPVVGLTDCESDSGHVYVLKTCNCITSFNPSPGKYLISVWVKVKNKRNAISYTDPNVSVSFGGGSLSSSSLSPNGRIIDGWQKIEGSIIVPINANNIKIKLQNNGSDIVYFDDFRIHPFLAGMTTTVYDPKTLLPLATHDGYNYTTFYNYDENYNLVGTKVETIQGIKSVSSSESGFVKKYSQQ